ncbi:MAG TPA: efflux RND transporter periplasmic adaptor subunit [Dongiaceae bacterium]|jgi:RND family efflux transporter MFP subunit|nr:efflux RND transporter periplasmic adaptor subunit [Dongiaceae bacterium]
MRFKLLKPFAVFYVAVTLVALGGMLLGALPGRLHAAEPAEKQLYTCGMHPQVIQDHPGNCPICGMKLTPMRRAAGSLATITIDPVTMQNMGFRSELVLRGPLEKTIRTYATIDFDETHLADVTTKFKGWIEKLYVDTTGQQVHRGDPLFEIYAPELFSAQTEYILALSQSTNLPGSDTLRATARAKLKFYDISDAQIAELEQSREPKKTLQILAPTDGFVVEKMVVAGQMVDAGMKLYQIADLATVWVQAQIYEQDLPFVKLGQEADVSLSYLQDRKFRGRVTYIYPTVDEKTRTTKVRMEFHNPGYFLKPGMFATVELQARLADQALLVPDSAVLRSGEKNTVFVALDGGKFEPRTVTLGPRGEGQVFQVLSGLNAGDHVVTSGQFMLDSESQLREAIQKMLEPNATPGTGEASPAIPATTNETAATTGMPLKETATATNTVYICPMPEHVSIRYDHPGKCPLCGMTLVPVSEATLEKIQPGEKILYYACPMTEDCPTPEHGLVKYDKPGKCPVCGMTLIPVTENTPNAPAVTTNTPTAGMPETLYTCPMKSDADVVSDKPGECPKCGMTLVPTRSVAHGKIAEEHWQQEHQH